MATIPKVFVSEPVNQKGLDLLKGKVDFIFAPDTSKATTLRLIGDADAALLRATTIFDKDVLNAAPRLKIIARTGTGFNNVDIKSAENKGIYICTTPGTNAETVAEHTLAMVLALAKQVIHQDKAVREQQWVERFSKRQIDIKGKTIGLVGFGNIGKATALKCLSLGLNVIGYDPRVKKAPAAITLTSNINDIVINSDFVSLHCPANTQTLGLMNLEKLRLMKKTAYLINTSRGDLVVEADLIQVLKEGGIAGAALDVFTHEPLSKDNELMMFSNVILSPHVAGSTVESNERIAMMAAKAILDFLDGATPLHIVNNPQLIENG